MIFVKDVMPNYVICLHYDAMMLYHCTNPEEFKEPSLDEMLEYEFINTEAIRTSISILKSMLEHNKYCYESEPNFFQIDETPYEDDDGTTKTFKMYTWIWLGQPCFSLDQANFDALDEYLQNNLDVNSLKSAYNDMMAKAGRYDVDSEEADEYLDQHPELSVNDYYDIALYIDAGRGDLIEGLRRN